MKPRTYRVRIKAFVEPGDSLDYEQGKMSQIDLFLDAREIEQDYGPNVIKQRLQDVMDLLGHDITKNLDALHGESK